MTDFENVLADGTARGTNIVPGCVVAAVDKDGNFLSSKASGYSGVGVESKPINLDTTFWIASCTKLIGTVAVLQCVERGQIYLDEPVGHVLHELANPEIIHERKSGTVGSPFNVHPTTKKITARQLLCHTSGLAYDIFNPTLAAWRASRGESLQGFAGDVTTAHAVPLVFEPGEGWSYSGGVDWAGEMVARVNNTTFGHYVQQHIFEPLGMKSPTFRLENHPETLARLMEMTERTVDGDLKESVKPWPDNAPQDCAGIGLYCSMSDYVKVIGDLIKDSPILLGRKTIEKELFTPQLAQDSPSLKGLWSSADILGAMTGATGVKNGLNFNVGGLYMEEEGTFLKEGTLVWGGYPNLVWFMNRKHGVAAVYATQLLPAGDPKSRSLAQQFMQEVWRITAR